MKRTRTLLASLLALVVMTSCSYTTMLSGGFPPKADDAYIEIFYSHKPKRPYTDIALLHCPFFELDYDMSKAKEMAREVGADAIIINKDYRGATQTTTVDNSVEHIGNKRVESSTINTSNKPETRIIAIKYLR